MKSHFFFFELRDVLRTFSITISGYLFFRKFWNIQNCKIKNLKKNVYKRDCSTSPSGGNQIDGSPHPSDDDGGDHDAADDDGGDDGGYDGGGDDDDDNDDW